MTSTTDGEPLYNIMFTVLVKMQACINRTDRVGGRHNNKTKIIHMYMMYNSIHDELCTIKSDNK